MCGKFTKKSTRMERSSQVYCGQADVSLRWIITKKEKKKKKKEAL
jgi:hypothetical protein